MKNTKKKSNLGIVEKRWTIGKTIMFVVLVLYSLSFVFVIGWAFLTTMKTKIEYLYSAVALPSKISFENYVKAFTELEASGKGMFTMLYNSLWLSVLPPTINLLTAAMASYVMAQYKFPGRDLIWTIMVVMMVLPILGTSSANYKLVLNTGMYNSPLFLLKSITGLGGSMFLIASFKGVSKTYKEAAFLEGAGHFRIFFQIMLPQITATLTALWIMQFITKWNDAMTAIMYLPDYTPISTGIYIYQKETQRKINVPILFSAALMVIVPPLLLFAFFQEKFMALSFGGGLKG